jgi:phospholipase C
LLVKVLTHIAGKPIRESNISAWRRAICGDLTSAFQPALAAAAAPAKQLEHPSRNSVLESIHKAQFKDLPSGYRRLSAEQLSDARAGAPGLLARQEPGSRLSVALAYQLYAHGRLTAERSAFEIELHASREFYGDRAAGSPFHVYTPGLCRGKAELRTRAYAVEPGRRVTDGWLLDGFGEEGYRLPTRTPSHDLALTIGGHPNFLQRFAGRVETGDPGRSDPAIGRT